MPAKGKYDTVHCYTHIHMGIVYSLIGVTE